jgi:indolepyruvate ferredoxin oxidoreductase
MIYHQTCAAEKRRLRRRGQMVDPPKRVFINDAVCEGCGDCSVQSNCISVEPLETELGRKRKINQSSCNKDYSCLKGFCPSFVTVHGGAIRRTARPEAGAFELPDPPPPPSLDSPYNIGITGIGGTGVLTIGAILGMAAHLEGKAVMVLDMAGLAQKGGAVLSHVRLGRTPDDVASPRIVVGGSDLLLAADSVVAVSKEGLSLLSPTRTRAVVNGHTAPIADFVRHRELDFRHRQVEDTIRRNVRRDAADFVDFTTAAEEVVGDSIATNIMMVGYA